MGWNRGVPQGSCSKMGGTRAGKTYGAKSLWASVGRLSRSFHGYEEWDDGDSSSELEITGAQVTLPQIHLSLLCFQYVNPLTGLPSLNSLMIFCYPQYKFQPLEFISSFSLSVSIYFRDTPPLLGSLLLPVH